MMSQQEIPVVATTGIPLGEIINCVTKSLPPAVFPLYPPMENVGVFKNYAPPAVLPLCSPKEMFQFPEIFRPWRLPPPECPTGGGGMGCAAGPDDSI